MKQRDTHRTGKGTVSACGNCCSAPGEEAPTPIEFADDQLTVAQRKVRSAAFRSLLHGGGPADLHQLAADTGLEAETVEEAVGWFQQRGFARRHSDGQVVGIAGLTVMPTEHRIESPFGTRWTWCALDAVGIVAAIGDGTVHSQADGRPIRVTVRDGALSPTELVVFLPDGYAIESVVDEWCPHTAFHLDRAAAEAWQAETGLTGQTMGVDRIASLAGPRWKEILDSG